MSLLQGLRIVQIGEDLAAAVCGRLLADAGPDMSTALAAYLDHGKPIITSDSTARHKAIATADLIVCEGRPQDLRALQYDLNSLRRLNATAVLVYISPFGQTGPKASQRPCDRPHLVLRQRHCPVVDRASRRSRRTTDPPGRRTIRLYRRPCRHLWQYACGNAAPSATVDVSIQEALATAAMAELARAGLTGKTRPRKQEADGNGATVTISPARDRYVAISPREDRQWASWLAVMGSPDWGNDPRFATKSDRVANWDALHALMCTWSRQYGKQWIANAAQAAHVPSFPLREPAEQLGSPQLDHRKFWRRIDLEGRTVEAPGSPFGLQTTTANGDSADRGVGPMPLSGVRVFDFSWVIAGPTPTRYLATMGADVIKIAAPGRGDPGRASELHIVLGQAKRSIVLDLKKPEAVAIVRALAARSDVLVENFATGVMDRLGLDADDLQALNPNLLYVSASGSAGPARRRAPWPTALCCNAMPVSPGSIAIPIVRRGSGSLGSTRCAA